MKKNKTQKKADRVIYVKKIGISQLQLLIQYGYLVVICS